MCLNCGCKMMDDSMGNDNNLTLTDLAKAAIASSMDGKETLENMKESLEIINSEDLDKKIAELKDQSKD